MKIAITPIKARIKARTAEIKVGERYFLSSFYAKEGAYVIVKNKSTKINGAGWPSSVTVEVVETIGDADFHTRYYAPGTIHTVNATNLYETREGADPAVKYAKKANNA